MSLGTVHMQLLRAVAAGGCNDRHVAGILKNVCSGPVAAGIAKTLISGGYVKRHRGGLLSVTAKGRAELPVTRVFVGEYVPPQVSRRPGSMDFARAPSVVGGSRIPWGRA